MPPSRRACARAGASPRTAWPTGSTAQASRRLARHGDATGPHAVAQLSAAQCDFASGQASIDPAGRLPRRVEPPGSAASRAERSSSGRSQTRTVCRHDRWSGDQDRRHRDGMSVERDFRLVLVRKWCGQWLAGCARPIPALPGLPPLSSKLRGSGSGTRAASRRGHPELNS